MASRRSSLKRCLRMSRKALARALRKSSGAWSEPAWVARKRAARAAASRVSRSWRAWARRETETKIPSARSRTIHGKFSCWMGAGDEFGADDGAGEVGQVDFQARRGAAAGEGRAATDRPTQCRAEAPRGATEEEVDLRADQCAAARACGEQAPAVEAEQRPRALDKESVGEPFPRSLVANGDALMGKGPDDLAVRLGLPRDELFAKAFLDLPPLRRHAQRVAEGFDMPAGEQVGEQVDDDARGGVELVVAVALQDGDGGAQLGLASEIDGGQRLQQGEAICEVRAMGIELDDRAEVLPQPRFPLGTVLGLAGLVEQGDAWARRSGAGFPSRLHARFQRLRHIHHVKQRRAFQHGLEQAALVDEKAVIPVAGHELAKDGERIGGGARFLQFAQGFAGVLKAGRVPRTRGGRAPGSAGIAWSWGRRRCPRNRPRPAWQPPRISRGLRLRGWR